MGCNSSVPAHPSGRPKQKKFVEYQMREEGSSGGCDKETTASGKNSARKAITVWDIQQERERRSMLSRHSSARSVSSRISESDRFLVTPTELKASGREYASSIISDRSPSMRSCFAEYTPRNSGMGHIPAWQSRSSPMLYRSSSANYYQPPSFQSHRSHRATRHGSLNGMSSMSQLDRNIPMRISRSPSIESRTDLSRECNTPTGRVSRHASLVMCNSPASRWHSSGSSRFSPRLERV